MIGYESNNGSSNGSRCYGTNGMTKIDIMQKYAVFSTKVGSVAGTDFPAWVIVQNGPVFATQGSKTVTSVCKTGVKNRKKGSYMDEAIISIHIA